MRGMEINTFFQGNPVSVQATFKTLMGGLTYMAYAEVNIPAKSMTLQVMNFNYQRSY